MPRRGMGVEIKKGRIFRCCRYVMPRRGMGVEISILAAIVARDRVMPRRGMGVEISQAVTMLQNQARHAPQGHGSRNNYRAPWDRALYVMPRRGMGVEIVEFWWDIHTGWSCPAGAWE